MSEKVPDSKHFDNRYDNADLQADRTTKDIAAAYTQFDEMRAYKMYLETLKIEAEMAKSSESVQSKMFDANGTVKVATIMVKDLSPQQSEFEQARRRVIAKLNSLLANASGNAKLKQLYAEFETDSIFELSSKITNYMMDKQRRDRVATSFDFGQATIGGNAAYTIA